MKVTVPVFYDKFKCKTSQCSDNCCIGWEIDIDKTAYNKYRAIKGAFGERLNLSIAHGETPSFILKNGRCPFLNEKNLCDIILELGEESICEICTEHPRFHEWFDGLTETGLGLCCEKTCELIFDDDKPLEFITREVDGENSFEPYDKPLFDALYFSRETAYIIARDRQISIYQRMAVLTAFAGSLQPLIDNGALNEIYSLNENLRRSGLYLDWLDTHKGSGDNAFAERLISLCGELEPIDNSWTVFYSDIKQRLDDVIANEERFEKAFNDYKYTSDKLLCYFIYRYFMKAVFDEEIISRVTLGVVCVILTELYERLIYLEKGTLTITDIERAAKLISKEIEYSEENIERLADECYGDVQDHESKGGILNSTELIAFLLNGN